MNVHPETEPTQPPVNPSVSARFARTRGKDTKPEMLVRRELHSRGFRYRVNMRPIPDLRRTGDIVFPRQRVVVLIDGCFFHACPVHHVPPKTRAKFWADKVAANVERDKDTTAQFEAAGWNVLRFWEHEPVGGVVARIVSAVEGRNANSP
ncbi:very short patch repair endonuclease [Terrabacter sp. RAF57]|uniref:very short patch repair endonuclease n=1 Tax=Terrabacter sp. RAF57 TaxID=3233063 RepID=UPI003F9E9FEA